MQSLWGDEFITEQKTQKKAKKILSKLDKPKKTKTVAQNLKSKTISIEEKINIIVEEVKKTLGTYADNTIVIRNKTDLDSYIEKAVSNNVIAIDTETNNSLDPITCKLMGLCLYTPGEKNAYIPVNHTDMNDVRLDWQVTENEIRDSLSKVLNTDIIMHNGKFDYKVIKCTCDIELPITWDTLIGAKVLDENEKSAGLKQQYIDKIDSSIEKYSIDGLFKDVPYNYFDPEVFALYAATDSYMTYRLYEWQKDKLERAENANLYRLFKTIEMPIVPVAAEMELTGVEVDQEYSKLLSEKYHKKLDEVDKNISAEFDKYKEKVNAWRETDEANFHPQAKKPSKDGTYKLQKSKSEQLEWPPNLASPSQLAILFYDVLGIKALSKKSPRGTGEDILKKMNIPLANLILERRGLVKLVDVYIDNIPNLVNIDGRVHTHFNQYGAQTGRFSSSEPLNLQNIPSHNKEIRLMFKPKDGNLFVGSDYSAQEPRLLAMYSGDQNMYKTYSEGRDLYSAVASIVYNNEYEANREFWPDGTPNPDGKKRRGNCKSIILGLMYGRGIKSIAEQIKSHEGPATQEDIQQAQEITNKFFTNYPGVKTWIDNTQAFAKEHGYVEDLWGRRRRLPDINLEKYEVKSNQKTSDFNPLLDSKGINRSENLTLIENYKNRLNNCRSRNDVNAIINEAKNVNLSIKDNSGFIAQAERQAVNARIQGGAASLSKRAMIDIYNDEKMRELGFKLVIAVHDELIGECPAENAQEVADRLTYLMCEAAKPECIIPMKCDPTIEECWYLTDYQDLVRKEFEQLLRDGKSIQEAFDIISEERPESTVPQLQETLEEFLK